jgi:hypothetical protein
VCRTEELELFEGEARFKTEIWTKHTLYQTNKHYLPKTVTIVVDAVCDGEGFDRVATLFVDLGTMCNSSSKGWVEAEALASGRGRKAQTYKIEVGPSLHAHTSSSLLSGQSSLHLCHKIGAKRTGLEPFRAPLMRTHLHDPPRTAVLLSYLPCSTNCSHINPLRITPYCCTLSRKYHAHPCPQMRVEVPTLDSPELVLQQGLSQMTGYTTLDTDLMSTRTANHSRSIGASTTPQLSGRDGREDDVLGAMRQESSMQADMVTPNGGEMSTSLGDATDGPSFLTENLSGAVAGGSATHGTALSARSNNGARIRYVLSCFWCMVCDVSGGGPLVHRPFVFRLLGAVSRPFSQRMMNLVLSASQ